MHPGPGLIQHPGLPIGRGRPFLVLARRATPLPCPPREDGHFCCNVSSTTARCWRTPRHRFRRLRRISATPAERDPHHPRLPGGSCGTVASRVAGFPAPPRKRSGRQGGFLEGSSDSWPHDGPAIHPAQSSEVGPEAARGITWRERLRVLVRSPAPRCPCHCPPCQRTAPAWRGHADTPP